MVARGILSALCTAVDRVADVCTWFAAAALALIMLVGVVDVVGAAVFNTPLPGALEGTEALLAVAACLPLARDQRLRRHIRLDIWTARLPRRRLRLLNRLGDALSALFYATLAVGAWDLALSSVAVREFQTGAASIPVYPAKLLFAVALSVMALACVANLARSRARDGHAETAG